MTSALYLFLNSEESLLVGPPPRNCKATAESNLVRVRKPFGGTLLGKSTSSVPHL